MPEQTIEELSRADMEDLSIDVSIYQMVGLLDLTPNSREINSTISEG
jgi:hypothetical protein